MNKNLEYINIEYNEKDNDYIDLLVHGIDCISKEIIEFFGIENFGSKVEAKLYGDINLLKNLLVKIGYYENIDSVPKWACGCAYKEGNIDFIAALSFEEHVKVKTHENDTLDDLKSIILHEFVHACHYKFTNEKTYTWLQEGLAVTLSHQYDDADMIFNITLEEAMNGGHDYRNYHTMFSYVRDTYGRDYILSLLNNFELLKQETPRLYDEVLDYINKLYK